MFWNLTYPILLKIDRQGAFGSVYKGVYENIEIAAKLLLDQKGVIETEKEVLVMQGEANFMLSTVVMPSSFFEWNSYYKNLSHSYLSQWTQD